MLRNNDRYRLAYSAKKQVQMWNGAIWQLHRVFSHEASAVAYLVRLHRDGADVEGLTTKLVLDAIVLLQTEIAQAQEEISDLERFQP